MKINLIVFTVILLAFSSCKQDKGEDHTIINKNESVVQHFDRDSIILKELKGSTLSSFAESEAKNIQALLSKGQLDSITMNYDCPNILDKGQLKVYREGREIKYILHTFQNGKQKASIHKYYLFNRQLFLTDLRDGYWSFEHGVDTRSNNISTDSKYYFNGLEGLECKSKKFSFTQSQSPDEEASKTNYSSTSCSKSRVILSKFRLLQSILNNPKRVDKPCIFY